MIGLVVLIALAAWCLGGFAIWKWMIASWVRGTGARLLLGSVLGVAWLSAPWADEYWGARKFEQTCARIPDVQFHGPVSVGAGPFFKEDGTPTWSTESEFQALASGGEIYEEKVGKVGRWDQMFEKKVDFRHVMDWPMPIVERRYSFVYRKTGQVVFESSELSSPGGWLRRATGFTGQYDCISKTRWPSGEKQVKF